MAKSDLNRCDFIGRLTRDPVGTALPSGDIVVNFSIAVGWKSKDKEGCEFVNCVAFSKLAEVITAYCKKGQQIHLSGAMRTRKYTDKTGVDRYTTEIVANQMQMLGSKSDGQSGDRAASQAEQYGRGSARPDRPPVQEAAGADFDDDIPF